MSEHPARTSSELAELGEQDAPGLRASRARRLGARWTGASRWLTALWLIAACEGDDVRRGQAGTMIDPVSDSDAQTPDAIGDCNDRPDGEACGEAIPGRHCVDGRCVFNVCGDGVEAGDEQCDDGNQVSGDGCDFNCEAEHDHDDARPADVDTVSTGGSACGDGQVDASEECDDGNLDSFDDCSNDCTENVCGNDRLDPGEECDDGNREDGDDCSSGCQRERCRNGHLDPGEECDDGNQIEHDGCNNRCLIMVCGDGKQQDREECDDGNAVDDDACSNQCTKNECGNGRLDPGEECDGGLNCDQCRMLEDTCTKCEEMHCRDYLGAGRDWVDGCLYNRPSEEDAPIQPGDMEFSGPCRRVLECARKSECVTDNADFSADACFCGADIDASTCTDMGPQDDSACYDEFRVAARAETWQDALIRLSNTEYPAAYAYYLLGCDVEFCKAECTPWLL